MGRSLGHWIVLLISGVVLTLPAGVAAKPASGPGAKLSTDLADLILADERGASVTAAAAAREITVTPGERVLVEVYATPGGAQAADRLQDVGAEVLADAPGPSRLTVSSAWVAVDALKDLAGVPGVRAVLPVQASGTDAGLVHSRGDGAHRGPEARALGPAGAGVKVGIISDSINRVGGGVAASQATGDLPPQVTILSDQPHGSDEGRAMAEIVYDTAPGITQMAFASGTAAGATGKADAIDALVASGARIIADDVFYLSEPFFQDGQVAQAVDRARAAGVLYVASAGNRARQSYESAPRFGPGIGALHDFDAGTPTDTAQSLVTVPSGRYVEVALQWDEAWGAARNDIDIELVRASDGALLAAAEDDNVATGLPREIVAWSNSTGSPVPVAVRIRFAGAAAGAPVVTRLKYIARSDVGTFSIAEHDTASDTINPDAASAAGALAVAAVEHDRPGLNAPEPFSSRGLKTRLFDARGNRLATPEVRQKPELAAADGVATTVPGFSRFYGTSAAAPSAAGVAALAWSANPALDVGVIGAAMTNPAHGHDCTLGGRPDADCGFGFILADRVVSALDRTPPVVSAVLPAPDGQGGWYRGAVPVSWSVADPQTLPERLAGCGATTVVTEGRTTLTCRARSVGGATEVPVTILRDATAPSIPVIAGIAPGAYAPSAVPPPSAIWCASSDATSGLAGCVVTGHAATPGTHTLTATATDVAGNRSTQTLTYSVVAPPPAAVSEQTPARPVMAKRAPRRLRAAEVIRAPSARSCVRASRRLKLRIRRPRTGVLRTVTVRRTGVRRAITVRRAGTIRLPRLTRKRTRVSITVRLTDRRSVTLRRTYRRC